MPLTFNVDDDVKGRIFFQQKLLRWQHQQEEKKLTAKKVLIKNFQNNFF